MSPAAKSFYDLEADLPKGDKLSMAQLKDKVVLIVNVASKVGSPGACGRKREPVTTARETGFSCHLLTVHVVSVVWLYTSIYVSLSTSLVTGITP